LAADKDIRYTVTAEDRFSRTFGQLRKDLQDGGQQLANITRLAGSAGGALGGIAASLAGGGSFLAFRQLAKDIDALNDASDAIGDSVENISALESVALRNGESLELVTGAVLKLNKVLGEAQPDSPLARSLQSIGLSAEELRDADPSQALQRVAQALQGYENDGNKARIIQDLFGKSTKQVAAFLNDLAAAGELNATVTAAQADQASRFNKQLDAMQAAAGNAARQLAIPMLSAVNQLFDAIEGRGVGGDSVINSALVVPLQAVAVLGANVGFVLKGIGTELGGLAAQAAAFGRGDFAGARFIGQQMKVDAKAAREQFDQLEKRLMNIGRVLPQADFSNEGRNQGGGLRRVQEQAAANTAAAKALADRESAAERYLERLQREGEKLEELTTVQQLLRDIEQGRVEGITPKLREKLFLEAASVDVMRRFEAERLADLREAEALERQIAATRQQAEQELQRILDATPTARISDVERRVDIVLRYARANPEDEAIQRQALEAVGQLRKEMETLTEPPKEVVKEVEKMQVSIDRFAEQSIDAIAAFVVDGKGSFEDLFKTFQRDVLRSLIEDPLRESMKRAVDIIKRELAALDGEDNPLANFFKSLGGGASSGGAQGGAWAELFAKLFSGGGGGGDGYMGRAGGGGVGRGQLVRWQENGREWFVPGQDGTVFNQAQMGRMGGGMQQVNTFNINGGDTATLRAELRAALDEREARLMRSLRNGRASSYVGA
jgi:hypothetical protein